MDNFLLGLIFAFIGGIGIGWFISMFVNYRKSKKMLSPVKATEEQPPKKEEPPKPTTRMAVMKVVLINNKTDKQYIIESVNDFGLTWSWVDEKGNEKNKSHTLLCVQQKTDAELDNWEAIGRFLDFSIIDTERKTFTILTEEVASINQQNK